MEDVQQRIAALEANERKISQQLLEISQSLMSAIKALNENGSTTDGKVAVLEAVTTALLAKASPPTQRYALSAVQVALEAYSDPEGPISRDAEFLASFRQQAAGLFPDGSWTP